jgi:aspartate-semialdehyde dehydrogenase
MKNLKVGVVGATGLVGEEFLKLLKQRNFPIESLKLFASDKSRGTKVSYEEKTYSVESLYEGCFKGLDLVFFSSGDDISLEWGPRAVSEGAFAVDNSGAFRMDEKTLLIVPEVNGELLPKANQKPSLIANPNCSTIQLVVALKPLAKEFGIKDVIVSTYQAVSGAGRVATEELDNQIQEYNDGKTNLKVEVFPHQIAFNCIPQIGSFNDNGFCTEELKVMRETRKILGQKDLTISSFTVRIPALNSHSEAVWVTLNQTVTRENLLKALKAGEGISVLDDPKTSKYPTALHATGRDEVFIGRIHQDLDQPNRWLMWVVSDNLRKGAALNGIQIAERIFDIRH